MDENPFAGREDYKLSHFRPEQVRVGVSVYNWIELVDTTIPQN